MSNINKINVNGTEYGVEGVAGDSKDDTTTFTSSDVTDGNATSWTSVNVLASGEKHSSIFAKVSQMFKNVRYLYKTLTALNINKLQIVECSTARSTAAKVVTLANFTLETGAHIFVRFTNTGSSNPSSGNLTLNVNSTGAKTIVDGHTNKTVMTYSNAGYFYNNYVAEFVYDGTYWVWLNRDNNTTYTGASLKTNAAKTGSGTTVTDTIPASTTMDNSIGTLLNNDVALNTNKAEKSAVANKADLASINITSGTTNNTGAKINSGTYFYYNGTFVRAKTDIANGATLTLNTNYEVVPVGTALATLKSSLATKADKITNSGILSKSVTIAPDAALGITATDLGYSIPSGKIPIGYDLLDAGHSGLMLTVVNLNSTGSGNVLYFRNMTANSVTATVRIRVLFSNS